VILQRTAPTWRARATELAVPGLFVLISLWVLGLVLRQVIWHGRIWTGTDGIFVTDQMTYLGWITDASHHWLASDPFQIAPSPADFFQPLMFVSGRLVALGLAPWLALLLWTPVSVLGLLAVTVALTRATLPSPGARASALALALLYVGPGAFIFDHLLDSHSATALRFHQITFDVSLGFWSWGYSFGLIAVAAATGALLAHAGRRGSGRSLWPVAALAALAGSQHPWQGAEVILTIAGAELLGWHSGDRPRVRATALALAGAALPLLYYVILDRVDAAWRRAQELTQGSFPVWMLLVTIGLLLLAALPAYRLPARGFLDRALRVWPLASLLVFAASETKLSAAPTHALLGITIPLGILAVQGMAAHRPVQSGWGRLAVAAALAALIVPTTVDELQSAHQQVALAATEGSNPLFIVRGEQRALAFLRSYPRPGGVLSNVRLGTVVPGITGRHTWVGNYYYSPAPGAQTAAVARLIDGQLPPATAQAFVRASSARFVLAGCDATKRLARELAPLVEREHRFGCATVLELR
jgi:hypothetical protein